ncbi:MAG: hypothetical protein PVF33_06020 [Candidatus Latescibacterota bacterium]|jgi:hypothetical protein
MGAERRVVALALGTIVLVAAMAAPAASQPAPVPNRDGEFTFGYSYQWFHRDMAPTAPVEKRWEVAAFTVAYGAGDRITVSLHGGYWDVEYDDFPGTDYERFVAGAGLSARLWRFGALDLLGEFQFSEVLDLDHSGNEFHKSTRSVLAGLYAARRWPWRRVALDVWVGPAFARDVGKNYFFGALPPLSDDSSDNVGVVTGARLEIDERVRVSAWWLYAGYVEPRIAVAVTL